MPNPRSTVSLEEQIDQWRSYLRRRQAIHSVDVAELEDHLREQVAVLVDAGLDTDEAFLVAVKRMGDLDALSREFAREHSDRLWKQLVVVASDSEEPRGASPNGCHRRLLSCGGGGRAHQGAGALRDRSGPGRRLLRPQSEPLRAAPPDRLLRLEAAALTPALVRWLVVAFVAAAVFANVYPFAPDGYTEMLTALHLPIALWVAWWVSRTPAAAGEQVGGRMDFIRFSGELFIYYVLIALGGGVLMAFMAMIFQAIGIDVEPFFESWLLPCGAVGAVVVASWLVEAKQSVIENMAPVLTRLFTPLFAAVLVTFLGTMLWTGRGVDIERDVLIAFDLLLVIVLALLLYSVSARDPLSPPGVFDVLQVVLVVSALAADAVALWAIAARITEFGFTPNRVAALGENVILLVNLAWSAVLYIRFLRGRGSFAAIERWQTDYVPVYAVWAAIVVIVFPPLFAYI